MTSSDTSYIEAINEFRGINHVTIHLSTDDGEPLCAGRREEGNDLYGPHKVGVTPNHIDVCPNCKEAYES